MSQAVSAHAPVVGSGWLGWKVISLLGKHRRTVAGLLALILVASGLDISVPFLTQRLIDQILHSFGTDRSSAVHILITAAVAIFLATASTRLLRSFYNYRLVLAASQAEDEVKNAAFANFLRLDAEYHGKVNTGEVVGALDRGGTAIYVVLNEILGQNLVPPLLVVIGVLTSLLMKNAWIALMVFTPLPAYVLAVSRLGGRMHKTEQQVSRAFENVTKESYDIASNVRAVKKFGRESQEGFTQRSLLQFARGKHHGAERLWAVVENVQSFIATAGRVGVIALGGYFVLTRRCTVGDYVLFIAMQDMVYGPISQLSIILPKLRRNLSRAERLFEILEAGAKVCDAPDAQPSPGVNRSVEFRDVYFKYAGSESWNLKSINFTVPAGSTVALIGPSGSGKSTLMNLMQRMYDPQSGSILIDGVDLRKITQQSLRDQIAVVPQEVELFSRSIIDNIGYGRDHIVLSDVEQAARMAHAHDFIQRCDNGYETQVGERGAKLSGGERQRIGIARAIMRDPKILILDEATSHLDNESERLIQVAMEKLTRGRTCFIIAHRLSTVRKADLVVVFSEGAIEAVGTHESLWESSPTYRKLHGLHIAERPRPQVTDGEAAPQPVLAAVGE
ncbi:MAG: ABC transporter ATP-binding protein [Acidobacteriaceae bacterium]|nr:ABC transporter ATP-binding protein [Acidobacteriaceae bacterium]